MRKQKHPEKIIVGITGGFGTGKTTVANLLKSKNTELINADTIAREIMQPGRPAYRAIARVFGKGILKEDKSIDRKELSHLAFNNATLLKKLNRITQPKIIRLIKERTRVSGSSNIIVDAPLLIEAGLEKFVDILIVVTCRRSQQITRLLKKTSLSRAEIAKRIRRQLPLQKKISLADFVIDNSGTVRNTRRQVENIRRLLWNN